MSRNNEEGIIRVLGLDPGEKRTGIAISDPLGIIASGLDTFVKGKGKDLIDYIEELAGEYNIKTVVVGMPLSMSGNEIEGSKRSRALASSIKARIGAEIVFIDERMSSLESERVLRQAGRIRDKGNIDKLSAVLILQSYLDGVDS
jgi:putative Holliday junction resolvase